jgi:hypothetical protein
LVSVNSDDNLPQGIHPFTVIQYRKTTYVLLGRGRSVWFEQFKFHEESCLA